MRHALSVLLVGLVAGACAGPGGVGGIGRHERLEESPDLVSEEVDLYRAVPVLLLKFEASSTKYVLSSSMRVMGAPTLALRGSAVVTVTGKDAGGVPVASIKMGNPRVIHATGTASPSRNVVDRATFTVALPKPDSIKKVDVVIHSGPNAGQNYDFTLPPAPTGVSATAGSTEITIQWNPVPGATSYNLYWDTTPGVTKMTGNMISGVAPPYVHMGLTHGIRYYYVVTALAGADESSESAEVSAILENLGILDPSFGGSGWIVHAEAAGGTHNDEGNGIAVDSSGRIVVAGVSPTPGGDLDMVIWRYMADGSLDGTFNGQGWVVHDSAARGSSFDVGVSVVVDASNRILVAGRSQNPAANDDMVVWRFVPAGTIDVAFGAGGVLVHDSAAGGSGPDGGNALTLDASGRILVTGYSQVAIGNRDMVVWRLNTTGSLDNTFNGQGWVVHGNAAGGNNADSGRRVTTDASGRILVTGFSQNLAGDREMAIWRYNDNGTIDTTFNGQGWVLHNGLPGGTHTDGSGIALDASGRILVAGSAKNAAANPDVVIWRYSPGGMLDAAFGTGGLAIHDGASGPNSGDMVFDMILNESGKIYVSGLSGASMAIWRFDVNGSLDTGFGGGQGFVLHDNPAGGGTDNGGSEITLDSSGRILVSGYGGNPAANRDMIIWRYR